MRSSLKEAMTILHRCELQPWEKNPMTRKKKKKKLIACIQPGTEDSSQPRIKSGRVLFPTDTQEFTENIVF